MTEHEVREKIVRTVDTCFSDLRGDPWLAQRIRNSAKGEMKVKKKLSFGLVLVIGLIAATMAVAIAAVRLGWIDYYAEKWGVSVPTAAQEAMEASQSQSYQVGPMTFTYNQLLTDKRLVLSSAEIRMTDGSEVLYADSTNFYEAVDALSDTVLKKYGLEPGITWVDAAKQLNLPLYGVRALAEVAPEHDAGMAMEDALWNEDGSIVYFNMPFVNSTGIQDELPATLYMAVHRYDPATDEVSVNAWTERVETAIPIAPLLAEKTYLPDGNAELNGIKLQSVYAEQYATGIYLTATFTMPDGMDADAATEALYRLTLLDGSGDALPTGLNLSGNALTDELPTARLEVMTSAEALPDSLIVTDGETEIPAK